ncbi:hypothetical protein [Pseudomonas sp. F1002]|uniref:hypothetical protein n=1 Tax=Pseudomonas sp. F1002 TaxID=2738821 RepID=UPI0015A00CB4|nr:hypothetical protein [Pseudomonas sp. F1002]NWB64069.1 hypothetical protein [Pseudomonas sp. F1002]
MSESKNDLTIDEVPILKDVASITSRAKYQSPLSFHPDHRDRMFGGIIAPYHLHGEKIKCGIQSCRTPHWHGYLISTSDDKETNIGKDCGKNHFKADFSAEMKRHDALYERRLKLNRILDLKKDAPALLSQLISLQDHYDHLKSMRFKFRGCLSSAESNRLATKVKSADPTIYEYQARTKEERDAYLETNPAARKSGTVPPKEIPIGEIKGFTFLAATYKDEEIFNYINPLRQLIRANKNQITSWKQGQINETHVWIGKSKTLIPAMEYIIAQGVAFFTDENLGKLLAIGVSAESIEHVAMELKSPIALIRSKLKIT